MMSALTNSTAGPTNREETVVFPAPLGPARIRAAGRLLKDLRAYVQLTLGVLASGPVKSAASSPKFASMTFRS